METWTVCGARRKGLMGFMPVSFGFSWASYNCWDRSARTFNQLPEHIRLLTRSATGSEACTQL